MNDLVAYLLAQARYRPVQTAKFAAGEIWRRSRLRLLDRLEEDLPSVSTNRLKSRFAAFYPARALETEAFGRNAPGAAEAALQRAEKIHRHEFEIFGERVECGAEINWHMDWKTGYRWPVRKAGQLRIASQPTADGTDVKRPWELARFHHLLALGKAFLLTQERRHAEEFARQVQHFLRENPCPRGIHWAMPMEAAIRAVNWIAAGAFFAGEDSLDEAFWQEFLRGLLLHGRFVYAHREWNPVARGNHYLACVVGLLHLGAFFSELAEAQQWFEFARKEFFREMSAQVREDGVAHEGSSGYHVFSTELFLTGALVLARVDATQARRQDENDNLKVAAAGKLEKMFEFIAALAAGREHPPILGDADDGRLLPYCAGDADNAAHLLAVGREIFGREDWTAPTHPCEEVWWRLGAGPKDAGLQPGATGSARTGTRVARRAGADASTAFEESGYYFFSSERMRGSVRCGPLGINGWANHAHCDQLSVEFAWKGRPVVVDPGTYLYSGDDGQRNLFRSTRYHNSVVVDGQEQNRFWPGLLFRMVDDTRSKTRAWNAGEETVRFHGEHSGYRGVRVARRVVLDKQRDILLICDTLRGRGARTMEWFFHLAPGIEAEPLTRARSVPEKLLEFASDARGIAWQGAWRIGPLMMLAGTSAGKLEKSEERGWVAPRYGKREEAAVMKFRCKGKLPASAGFVFLPADEE